MFHRPTHLTATTAQRPVRGQSHRRKHWRKTTRARQGLGTPPTPHPNPWRCPSIPATHTPTQHSQLQQAGQPASPSTKAKPHTNQRRTLPGQDTKLMDQAPKPGTEIQRKPSDPKRAKTPVPAPINPLDPNPNSSPDPDQKAHSLSQPSTPGGKQRTGV
ncbi:hypothetical protein ILYODFUR_030796 [Ilyodon furcidens]|uniref:Uncharacterized protein n=1 Tax=Ilyodon furcidens TaxID=33524 RepID=A0ABV0VK49_9TELE